MPQVPLKRRLHLPIGGVTHLGPRHQPKITIKRACLARRGQGVRTKYPSTSVLSAKNLLSRKLIGSVTKRHSRNAPMNFNATIVTPSTFSKRTSSITIPILTDAYLAAQERSTQRRSMFRNPGDHGQREAAGAAGFVFISALTGWRDAIILPTTFVWEARRCETGTIIASFTLYCSDQNSSEPGMQLCKANNGHTLVSTGTALPLGVLMAIQVRVQCRICTWVIVDFDIQTATRPCSFKMSSNTSSPVKTPLPLHGKPSTWPIRRPSVIFRRQCLPRTIATTTKCPYISS